MVDELGLLGARIEHTAPFDKGSEGVLEIVWDEETISVEGRIVRTEVSVVRSEARGETTYLSGLEFVSCTHENSAALKKKMAGFVTDILERMKANARGEGEPLTDENPFEALAAGSARLGGTGGMKVFISCRLSTSGEWRRTEVLRARQPSDGFIVAANYNEEELQLLCRAYEAGDDATRSMIRACAELSTSSGEDVPPASFV